MTTTNRPRRLVAILGSAALAASLAVGLGSTMTPADADHAHPPGPVHAGNTYGWGKAPVDYRFVGPLKRSQWHVAGRAWCATSTAC